MHTKNRIRTVTIPRAFYSDHKDRDLPTPIATHCERTFLTIPLHGRETDELLADALHYADKDGPAYQSGNPGLASSARSTVNAIQKARAA